MLALENQIQQMDRDNREPFVSADVGSRKISKLQKLSDQSKNIHHFQPKCISEKKMSTDAKKHKFSIIFFKTYFIQSPIKLSPSHSLPKK